MEISIRLATLADIPHLVHHRRAMFVDMGHKIAAELDGADQVAHNYFNAALRDGSYKGWMVEEVTDEPGVTNEFTARASDARETPDVAIDPGTALKNPPPGKILAGGGIVFVPWAGYPGEARTQRLWIVNMYTEPRARRRGIAKKLVNTMTAWSRAEGYAAISLHASDAGRPVYESLGFKTSNEMKLSLR
jgi:GNAT superfamily N-acetyltransferase